MSNRLNEYDFIFIDGLNLSFRFFYGMSLSNAGKSTSVLYGIFNFLYPYLFKGKPEIWFLWDSKKSWRKEKQKEYKAQRVDQHKETKGKKISDFWDSLKTLKETLKYAGVYQVVADGYEADDLAYTLGLEKGIGKKCLFVSTDKDWWDLCLLGDILYYNEVLNKETIEKKFCSLFNLPRMSFGKLWLFKAIVGDPSDNVKGIWRFPKKIASELVCTYGDQSNAVEVICKSIEKLGYGSYEQVSNIIESNMMLLKPNIVFKEEMRIIYPCIDSSVLRTMFLEHNMKDLYFKFFRS